jgi:hypothetical protein
VYSAYRPKYYWFELVEMTRKLFMTGGFIIIGSGTSLQALVGVFVCFIYLLVAVYTNPLVDPMESTLVLLTAVQMFVTVLLGMYTMTNLDAARRSQVDIAMVATAIFALSGSLAGLMLTISESCPRVWYILTIPRTAVKRCLKKCPHIRSGAGRKKGRKTTPRPGSGGGGETVRMSNLEDALGDAGDDDGIHMPAAIEAAMPDIQTAHPGVA